MAVADPIDEDVQVRADRVRVVVVLRGPLDVDFAEVLGEGLAAALSDERQLLIDVKDLVCHDAGSALALGRLIDVVAATGHDVAVRAAGHALRAHLRRHPVSFVTRL